MTNCDIDLVGPYYALILSYFLQQLYRQLQLLGCVFDLAGATLNFNLDIIFVKKKKEKESGEHN